jgi:hypothetical protein
MYVPGDQFQHRQFSVTRSGCLADGARAMQTTEIVCLLYGDELAYILRPCGHHIQFLGECYVAQFSSGNWIKAQK